jgi:D-methionine transport system permease protein
MNEFLEALMPNVVKYGDKFEVAAIETLQMVFISLVFIVVLGIALGIVLVVITPGHLYGNRLLNAIVPRLVNLLRSIPFVLLIALILPFTRLVAGTAIGVRGAIVPIVIAMIPFVARQVEQAVFELDKGVIEMALSLGLSRLYILFRIILKEARTGITRIIILSSISLVGYSTMAGVVGGGGIGDLAIRYGYARFMGDVTLVSVILLLILVFGLQGIGNVILKRLSH